MDSRLTRLPDPGLAWLDDLLDPRQPVPVPKPTRTVRAIQRGQRAESASPVSGSGVWPDTHETAAGLSAALLGPVTALSPGYYRSVS